MIRLDGVAKSYHGRAALRGVTTTVERSEFVFLTGPSGAGKSTLLRLLYRAELPDSGSIVVNGRNLAELSRSQVAEFRRTLGVIFQDFNYRPYNMGIYLQNVADYVRGGGGFLMMGGDLSFSEGDYEGTPLAEVLPVPPIMKLIQAKGAIDPVEMHRVFNMGVGMVWIVPPAAVDAAFACCAAVKIRAAAIGTIILGNRDVTVRF